MNAVDYGTEALRQLGDASAYHVLPNNPTFIFRQQLSHLLDTGCNMGILSSRMVENLSVNSPVVPVFHHLPKLHKHTVPIQGRPIVAGIGSLFERLGHWVDQYIQPLVTRLPGYIKDSLVVLASIQDIIWTDASHWLTLDVKSLYSCIFVYIRVYRVFV